MKQLVAELERWQDAGEEIALATLVRVRGTAPRLPGARLIVSRSGRMSGSVSAGCVENDVFERAQTVLETGRPLLARYGIDDELAASVGLSCGGEIEVLIEPLRVLRDGEVWPALCDAAVTEKPVALCVGLEPSPLLGRSLLVHADGSRTGSLDAELDAQLASEARAQLCDGGTRVVRVEHSGLEGSVFVEGLLPQPSLFIVGATQIAVVLSAMARTLGFRVSVLDVRTPFATRERFPDVDRLLHAWPDEALGSITLDDRSYVVALSHDPKIDVPALACALRSPARYIGALGSRRTQERRRVALRALGFSDTALARIHGPLGLDIGSRTPEEIAVSIVAQLVAVRRGRLQGAPARPGAGAESAGRVHA